MNKTPEDIIIYISHKLQTRLMSISGCAQLLESGIMIPEDAEAKIQKECSVLTDDINKLISLSSLDFEIIRRVQTAVPVIELLENSFDRFSISGKEKNLSLRLIGDTSREIYAFGDEDLIEDILDNLISNAVRYANSRITVSVTSETDRVIIKVSDDGPGLAKKDLPYLFEKFYKGEGGNFGLGLYIASTSAKKMNGTLSAANRPEGGAEFTLTLPAADPHPELTLPQE